MSRNRNKRMCSRSLLHRRQKSNTEKKKKKVHNKIDWQWHVKWKLATVDILCIAGHTMLSHATHPLSFSTFPPLLAVFWTTFFCCLYRLIFSATNRAAAGRKGINKMPKGSTNFFSLYLRWWPDLEVIAQKLHVIHAWSSNFLFFLLSIFFSRCCLLNLFFLRVFV